MNLSDSKNKKTTKSLEKKFNIETDSGIDSGIEFLRTPFFTEHLWTTASIKVVANEPD